MPSVDLLSTTAPTSTTKLLPVVRQEIVTFKPQDITTIIREYLSAQVDPHAPKINGVNEMLETVVRTNLQQRGIHYPHLGKAIHRASNLVELGYNKCTFEEKVNIAIYTWGVIYIDDASLKNTAPFVAFQQRFIRGLPQLDPALDLFAEVLHSMCDQYDGLYANTFLDMTFEYINATCIEPAFEAMPLPPQARRFPWFLRDRTGLGVPYALMIFTKTRPLDFVTCFRALPDMNYWIALVNDLLSFYKEQLAGEIINYTHNRAYVENKPPVQILSEMRGELIEASENVVTILEESGAHYAVELWKEFEQGVIAWHLGQERYRLKELQL